MLRLYFLMLEHLFDVLSFFNIFNSGTSVLEFKTWYSQNQEIERSCDLQNKFYFIRFCLTSLQFVTIYPLIQSYILI